LFDLRAVRPVGKQHQSGGGLGGGVLDHG
jgi:hypothetical protein